MRYFKQGTFYLCTLSNEKFITISSLSEPNEQVTPTQPGYIAYFYAADSVPARSWYLSAPIHTTSSRGTACPDSSGKRPLHMQINAYNASRTTPPKAMYASASRVTTFPLHRPSSAIASFSRRSLSEGDSDGGTATASAILRP